MSSSQPPNQSNDEPKKEERDVPKYVAELYTVIGKVGEGTYGNVFLAHKKTKDNKILAIKTFKSGKGEDGVCSTAIREIMLLQELRHCNLVHLEEVHVSIEEASLSLAFGYAETDLYEMVKFHREKDRAGSLDAGFHPYTLKSLLYQMLQGINAMHKNWCMHRDMKPSNILVVGAGPESGTLKIADFGLARIFRSPLRPLVDNGTVVTIWYRAPELILGSLHYTPAIDIWAIGCIFAELITLRPLFQGEERKQRSNMFQADQMEKIMQYLNAPTQDDWPEVELLQHWRDNTDGIRTRLRTQQPSLRSRISENSKTKGLYSSSAALILLEKMLIYDPSKRITAEQALQHPYFKEAPLPGQNAFVYNGTRVSSYPYRQVTKPSAPQKPSQDPSAPQGAAANAPLPASVTPPPLPLVGSQMDLLGNAAKRRRTDPGNRLR